MVESVSNPNMHYGNVDVGVIIPPDKLPHKVIYSSKEGQRIYNDMQRDLYENSKKAQPPKRKFPLVLKILGGIIAFCAGIIFLGKKFNIGIFKKKAPLNNTN